MGCKSCGLPVSLSLSSEFAVPRRRRRVAGCVGGPGGQARKQAHEQAGGQGSPRGRTRSRWRSLAAYPPARCL
eukprot:3455205-Alexandrium_andersonii.AAC.1